jgi:hypothetical protein
MIHKLKNYEDHFVWSETSIHCFHWGPEKEGWIQDNYICGGLYNIGFEEWCLLGCYAMWLL